MPDVPKKSIQKWLKWNIARAIYRQRKRLTERKVHTNHEMALICSILLHVNNLYGIECETHNNWLFPSKSIVFADISFYLWRLLSRFVPFRLFSSAHYLYVRSSCACCWHGDQSNWQLANHRWWWWREKKENRIQWKPLHRSISLGRFSSCWCHLCHIIERSARIEHSKQCTWDRAKRLLLSSLSIECGVSPHAVSWFCSFSHIMH